MNTYRIKFKAEPLLSGVCDSLGWNTAGGWVRGHGCGTSWVLGGSLLKQRPPPLSASLPRPSLTREVGSPGDRDQGRGNRRRGRSGSPEPASLAGARTRRHAPRRATGRTPPHSAPRRARAGGRSQLAAQRGGRAGQWPPLAAPGR